MPLSEEQHELEAETVKVQMHNKSIDRSVVQSVYEKSKTQDYLFWESANSIYDQNIKFAKLLMMNRFPVWIDVKMSPGYSVSQFGEIRDPNGMVMKKIVVKDYPAVYIKCLVDGMLHTRMLLAHRIVADNFFLDPNKLGVVDHIDENKLRHDVGNLRFTTHQQNLVYSRYNRRRFRTPINQLNDAGEVIKEWVCANDINLDGFVFEEFIEHCYCKQEYLGYKWQWKSKNKESEYVSKKVISKSIGVYNGNDFSRYHISKDGTLINSTNFRIIHNFPKCLKSTHLKLNDLRGLLVHVAFYHGSYDNRVFHLDGNPLNCAKENLFAINLSKCPYNVLWTIYDGYKRPSTQLYDLQVTQFTSTGPVIHDNLYDAYHSLQLPYDYLVFLAAIGARESAYGFKWTFTDKTVQNAFKNCIAETRAEQVIKWFEETLC